MTDREFAGSLDRLYETAYATYKEITELERGLAGDPGFLDLARRRAYETQACLCDARDRHLWERGQA